MGTRFELVLEGADPAATRSAGEAAIELIEEAHRAFTRFEPSSLLAHLRRIAPEWAPVDRDTLTLFIDATEVARRSGGVFDPTRSGRWSSLEIDAERRRVRLTSAAVELDFGAIAKGHVIDLAVRLLRGLGIAAGFIHGGTSAGAGWGRPAERSGWRIGWLRQGRGDVVELVDQAFAVSATGQTREAATVPHLVDVRTGSAVAESRRALVVGPSARLADAWATVAAIIGRRPAALGPEWTVRIE